MFMRVAIVLLVIVAVVLLTPLALSAVKKAKTEYEEMSGDEEDPPRPKRLDEEHFDDED